ncbi:hypothetical protein [Micromonospora sp. NPDC047740]|uniref:hypothetical protein n=1 Tax=Micromonospora sp. NPDC047740 TaxID=3364254 RepID=UPI003722C2A5
MAASWAVRKQVEAERGEATPEAAATVWLLKPSAGEELGLSRVLAEPRHDELRQQWRDYRDEMTRWPPLRASHSPDRRQQA